MKALTLLVLLCACEGRPQLLSSSPHAQAEGDANAAPNKPDESLEDKTTVTDVAETAPEVTKSPTAAPENPAIAAPPVNPTLPAVPEPAVYSPCPPIGQVCLVMPLGDSITSGIGSSTSGGYRLPLFQLAKKAGKVMSFVGDENYGPQTIDGTKFPTANEGHPGWRIQKASDQNGIREIAEASLLKNKPHIVLLHIGTNDIVTVKDLEQFPNRLGSLLDLIKKTSPDTLIVLAKITPINNKDINGMINSYNTAMDKLVSDRIALGSHIIQVDMFNTALKDANNNSVNSYYNDGLHPNDSGYKLMADVWFKSLEPYLK